jgi:hypothetical protein
MALIGLEERIKNLRLSWIEIKLERVLGKI